MYTTGNYIQYPVTKHNEKEYEKVCLFKCLFESLGYLEPKKTRYCRGEETPTR